MKTFTNKARLSFQSVEMIPNYRAIVPQVGEWLIKKDVLGNQYKAYTFAFVGVQTYDLSGTSGTNTANMAYFDDFAKWITEQEYHKNYPNFGASNYKWELLQNMANLATYDNGAKTAKYMFSCRLRYVESEE